MCPSLIMVKTVSSLIMQTVIQNIINLFNCKYLFNIIMVARKHTYHHQHMPSPPALVSHPQEEALQ